MSLLEAPRLERVASFVPETSLPVADLAGPLGLDATQLRFFTRFLGLDRVAVADGLELADLLTGAGERVLAGTDRDSVRFLVHAHTMQHVAVATPGLLEDVRTRLRLHRATAFSLSHLNCVVGLHALHVARSLLATAAPGDRVLVLTGDKVLMHEARLIRDTTIQGDGAAAVLLGPDPRGDRVLGRALTVLGEFYRGIDCDEALQLQYKHVYPDALAQVMQDALDDARAEAADIAAILPHNVNKLSWKRITGTLGVPRDRVFLDNVGKYAHCYSSDPFINLAAARADGRVDPGDLVLLASAGLGATFAAAVVEIGEGNQG
ncbi:ketoacyl-ACP synthase III family protein [Amycolatopsis sp. Hca4]|uniref:ketoacyl-ACP synthase III family protein n=1 Tax=unclassified Amycolatopsis TaxID=2618356 RepID=UPI00159021D0|nr:ketoacyl-ACP synthase III family protein [Amycolatopsis sp. Hca4]QKV79974.1 ketoacyl-ACP synthase III family protein [Amycolatopsis sp. Hca4]